MPDSTSTAPVTHATLGAALASLDEAGLASYRAIVASGGDCLYAAACAIAGQFRAVWGARPATAQAADGAQGMREAARRVAARRAVAS